MTPHQLELTAFGPFPGTVAVDLDALSSAGLFLLHGATGAGKTTLLDGIGFALFGRVPGVRNAAKRLRSDVASPSVATSVSLEATLGGRRMRITRSPSWERPKTRGTGTTTQQASVLLEELVAGAWTCLSTRVGEADLEIADLVGMSAEQFFQVVLLPQGDFAQFLRSSSQDRAEVLKKLFATERFADVEVWLGQRRRTTAEALGAARDSVSRTVARIAEVAGADVPPEPSAAWSAQLMACAETSRATAMSAVRDATAVRDAARTEAEAAKALSALQARRRSALERRALLAREHDARLALQQELDAASRAAEVAAVLSGVGSRRARRDACLTEVAATAGALHARGVDAVDLRAVVAGARERLGSLEALKLVEAARDKALSESAQARAEQADALASVATAELELAGLPARQLQLSEQLSAARNAAARVPGLRAERLALAELRPELLSLRAVQARLVTLAGEHLSARETALALEIKANDLRVASINSMVAALAFRLEDGIPCEVCGSSVHPDPSQLRDEGVSSDDEERARRLAEQAQDRVASVQALLAADNAVAADLATRVGEWDLASLDAAIAALDLELDVLVALAAQAPAAELEAAEVARLMASLGTEQVAASTRADAAERRAEDALARAAVASAELAGALGADSVADAQDRTGTIISAATAALAAAESLDIATRELDDAVAAAARACVDAGFASTEDASAAVRALDWRTTSAASLREAADLAAAVESELSDPALDVALDPPAPVAVRAAELEVADEALAVALSASGSVEQRYDALSRLVPVLTAELASLEPLMVRAAEVRGLADLCAGSGANGLKMTLTSFVLAARLEEVASAASVRLLRMTQGRYSLVHTDGAARGGQRSGLGLLARDGWTGHDRDTSTLSGGETFLASLALALGLADVVSAEAGGSRIGALFVDEGFGTLDEDSLDEVMEVLDGLREGGRIVGLVSHVTELRHRIPAQVEVRKTRTGSDVVLHGC